MLGCCMRNPAVEKGTETLLKRSSFRSPDMRDIGEKDLHTELTYDTLRIVADPTRLFRLEQYLGTMHLFEVWDARDIRDNKRVMVKIMTKDTKCPDKCIRQEDALSAQAIYNLDCGTSSCVAGIYGLFEQYPARVGLNFFATKVWYVQDYAGPLSLCDYLVQMHKHPKEPKVSQGMTDEGHIARIMQQLLEAVHEAHQAKVILRNICTMNIYVSANGEKVRIHDFWYCVDLPEEADEGGPGKCFKSTVWAGYPSCLAPEALLGNYHQAGDIWSLGLVAYELACGANPFTAVAVECLLEGISLQVAQKLSRRVADASVMLDIPSKTEQWSPAFQAFVRSMINRDPAARPSAAELLEHPFLRQDRH